MFARLSYYSPAMRQWARKDFNSLLEESVKNTAVNCMKVETNQIYYYLVLVNDEVMLKSVECTLLRLKGLSNKNFTVCLQKFLTTKIEGNVEYFNNTIISLADRVKIVWLGYAIDNDQKTLDICCNSTSTSRVGRASHECTHEHITLLPSKDDPSSTRYYIKNLLLEQGVPYEQQDFVRHVIENLYPYSSEESSSSKISTNKNPFVMGVSSEQIAAIANAASSTFQLRAAAWCSWLKSKFY